MTIDNRAGAKMATEHLSAQDCRMIGLIAGPLDWWEVQERMAGSLQTPLQETLGQYLGYQVDLSQVG